MNPTTSYADAPKEGLRFFWQPGCSSCVKVKEMLTDLGVTFASINILEHPAALQELMDRGARSVPVLTRGEELIFTQSLEDVAKFVGLERAANRLSMTALMDRWQYFLKTGIGLARQIPADKFKVHPIKDRARTVGSLAYHIFQIPEGFLEVVNNGLYDSRDYDNAVYDHLRTVEDVLGFAEGVQSRLQRWWETLDDKSGKKTFDIYYGRQPMHQILERCTWHSAQHTRQLNVVLDGFGIKLNAPIKNDAYDGLPMPQAVWA